VCVCVCTCLCLWVWVCVCARAHACVLCAGVNVEFNSRICSVAHRRMCVCVCTCVCVCVYVCACAHACACVFVQVSTLNLIVAFAVWLIGVCVCVCVCVQVSTLNLIVAFAVWLMWSILVVRIQKVHDEFPAKFRCVAGGVVPRCVYVCTCIEMFW